MYHFFEVFFFENIIYIQLCFISRLNHKLTNGAYYGLSYKWHWACFVIIFLTMSTVFTIRQMFGTGSTHCVSDTHAQCICEWTSNYDFNHNANIISWICTGTDIHAFSHIIDQKNRFFLDCFFLKMCVRGT